MTTIRQLIQTSPTRANELFAKLVDTTDNAVKTRGKLFSELKDELNVLTELEETHLFPVLRKQKQTKELVAEAIGDNKQMRRLIGELDKISPDNAEFGSKVAELRTVFQLHVRDEKKELLPAVLKAISDEEAQAIVERIEDRKAEIEEERRSEADERRAAARHERERDESVKQVAETVASTIWAGPKVAQQTARNVEETAGTGIGVMSDVAQRTSDHVFHLFDQTGEQAQQFAQQSSKGLSLMAEAGSVVARGFQELSQESWRLMQGRVQQNLDGFTALARCRSFSDLLAVQNEFVRDQMQQTIEETRTLSALAARVAEEATKVTSSSGPSRNRSRAA